MKLTRTAFPDGSIIDHQKHEVDVRSLVDDYRYKKALEKSKELIEEAKEVNKQTIRRVG